MKKLFYILILFSLSVQAQLHKMPADSEFFYTYGGINFDEARDIKETSDKGYILAGTTASFGQGQASFYLIKTDSLGNHIWSSVQGGPQNDWAYTVQTTYDSGIFVAGFSSSFDPTGNNSYNAYYLKTDKNGHLIWQKSVYASDFSFIYGSCPMPDSGFILCGRTYANTNGGTDAYLIRINKNGDTLWTHNYGGAQDEVFNSVCIINNKIYAVGSNASHPADTKCDGWIVKLNMNGVQLQEAFISYGNTLQENLNGITPYVGNLFTVCGSTFHPDSIATTGILIKYDTSLVLYNLIANSAGNYPKGYYFHLNKVINISNDGICAIGTRNGGSGGLGVFLLGTDRYNNTIYFGTGFSDGFFPVDGGSADDKGYSGIFTSGGKVITVGSTLSTQEYCINNNLAAEDAFLIRYNTDSIHVAGVVPKYNCFADTLYLAVAGIKNFASNNLVSLYPNPVYDNATLTIIDNSSQQFTGKVYSILGEEVFHFDNIEPSKNNTLNFSALRAGSYFLKIESKNGSTVSILKFIVIK